MGPHTKAAIAGIAVIAAGTGTMGVATAGSDDDATETPITGGDLNHATRVALDHTGDGRVTGTEVGDEESYYEVEVTLSNGDQVDVQLDRNFEVVNAAPDSENDG